MLLIDIQDHTRICTSPKYAWACAGPVKKKVALIGKGLTFDSGGYNLKVGGMIELMKFDMGGAGAVFGAAQIIADLEPEGVEVSLAR